MLCSVPLRTAAPTLPCQPPAALTACALGCSAAVRAACCRLVLLATDRTQQLGRHCCPAVQHCAVRSGLLPASAAQRARAAPPLRRRTRRSLSALPPLTAYCRHWALRTCRHEPLIFRRLSRVALHEICHMFGLRHCIFFKCLMNGTNCLQENDLRPPHLCPICLHKLQLCIGFDLVVRFQELRCPCFVLSSQPLLLHVLIDSLVCVRVCMWHRNAIARAGCSSATSASRTKSDGWIIASTI